MNKGVRRVRKSISKRKKMRGFPNEKNRKHINDITPVLPQAEEKHGVYPSFFENTSSKNESAPSNRSVSTFLLKGTLSVILFLSVAILWESDVEYFPRVEKWTPYALTEEFAFAKVNHWYKTTVGHPM